MKRIITVLLILASLLSLASCNIIDRFFDKDEVFDYTTFPLSEYLYVPEEIYKGYDVTVYADAPTERDVDYHILKMLAKYKYKNEISEINTPGITVGVGDIANIYYRGYTLGEDGGKKYFDGGCNFTDSTYALEIGSGAFISGFEYNLIGKNQNDYATIEKIEEGLVNDDDIISLTYSVYRADKTASLSMTALIDLSDPSLDTVWGEGFSAYFKNSDITVKERFGTDADGEKLVVSSATDADGEDIYFDMIVNSAFRKTEGVPLVVEARFPKDYLLETLRGKTAYFEVYIKSVRDYEVYEFDDAFVTDRIKFNENDQNKYEGETALEKYRNHVMEMLQSTYEEKVDGQIIRAFWDQALLGTTFYKLPEDRVEEKYDSMLNELARIYNNNIYSAQYASLDAFARAYYDLDFNSDWKSYVRGEAERFVKKGLILYYIIRTEGLPIYSDIVIAPGYETSQPSTSINGNTVIFDKVTSIPNNGSGIIIFKPDTSIGGTDGGYVIDGNNIAFKPIEGGNIMFDSSISGVYDSFVSYKYTYQECYVNIFTEVNAEDYIISGANVIYA